MPVRGDVVFEVCSVGVMLGPFLGEVFMKMWKIS
jgi:hypothetical protein